MTFRWFAAPALAALVAAGSAAAQTPTDACLAAYGAGPPPTSDLAKVVKVFKGAGLARSEFDTTAEFEARSSAAIRRALVAAGLGEQPIVFASFSISPKYDADAGAFLLRGEYSNGSLLQLPGIVSSGSVGSPRYPGCPGDCSGAILGGSITWAEESSYAGSNAYGATTRVTKRRGRSVGVRPAFDGSRSPYASSAPGYGVNGNGPRLLAIPREEAVTAKDALQVSFCFEVLPPYVATDTTYMFPSRTVPFDVQVEYDLLIGRTLAYAIYNSKTGKIYSSAPLPHPPAATSTTSPVPK